ncbi:MAG: hypothetical protein KH216_09085, partial [Clostridiales bacterium]|nr:hypothetical protein [Clostridiales bacterium]
AIWQPIFESLLSFHTQLFASSPMLDAAKRRRALACKYEGTSRRNEQRGYAATRRIRAGKDIFVGE